MILLEYKLLKKEHAIFRIISVLSFIYLEFVYGNFIKKGARRFAYHARVSGNELKDRNNTSSIIDLTNVRKV